MSNLTPMEMFNRVQDFKTKAQNFTMTISQEGDMKSTIERIFGLKGLPSK